MIDMNTYRYFNPNPYEFKTRDCVIRAMCVALNLSWDDAFDLIADRAKQMGRTMDDNSVFGSILREYGFNRAVISNRCPDCFTAHDFCLSHPRGIFVLGFDGHVAAVIDGTLFDSWDSSDLIPQYYYFETED